MLICAISFSFVLALQIIMQLEAGMESFLATKSTIGENLGMGAWSLPHILWLLAGALFTCVMALAYRHSGSPGRKRLAWTVAGLTLADESVKYIITIPAGLWEWGYLPLHLCSLSVFMILAHVLTDDDRVAEALYGLSLPSALMALIFPNWMMLPCMNWQSIHSFSIHILIVTYPVMLLAGGFRPRFSRLLYSFPPLLLAMLVAAVVNSLLGTNFFFLNTGEAGNPLALAEALVGGWYILTLPLSTVILWTVMYLVPKKLRWLQQ